MKKIVQFFTNLTHPRSLHEDRARREFILNVLLLSALWLLFIGIVVDILDRLFIKPLSYSDNSLSSLSLYALFSFFFALYILSRRQWVVLSSYLLLAAFFSLSAYMGFHWGVDVTASLLFYALTIIMAGILVSTRTAFGTTFLVAITMLTTGYAERSELVEMNKYWREDAWIWSDIVMILIIFLIIAIVSWLSNRKIEKSLRRARRSEAALREERDMLEVRVIERTTELRQAEMEKMSQAYHFVEFGRLASGIFHDLMNPLTALSLNIDHIAAAPEARNELAGDLQRAKRAANHMQALLESMRKHLSHTGEKTEFSTIPILHDTFQVLSFYARAREVELVLNVEEVPDLYGDPVAFTQIVTNLIGNAIHSYTKKSSNQEKNSLHQVVVSIQKGSGAFTLKVTDYGSGIAPEVLPKLFEPFFTTKDSGQGIGLGLSLAKRIVEKDFGGTITVDSVLGSGSTFTVYLPVREP